MRIDLFSIPIFQDKVDLSKIQISDEKYEEIWLSETPSTFGKQHNIRQETFEYLAEVISRNIAEIGPYQNPRFGQIWRNKYGPKDTQDVHIHPNCQWSFIIYETIEESKTVFLNPSYKLIMNQLGLMVPNFPIDYRPALGPGDIIIFPSFLEHLVAPGGNGTTISGNVYVDYQ